eukprot:1158434-Pelagomonas_calceolata.AAC.9
MDGLWRRLEKAWDTADHAADKANEQVELKGQAAKEQVVLKEQVSTSTIHAGAKSPAFVQSSKKIPMTTGTAGDAGGSCFCVWPAFM